MLLMKELVLNVLVDIIAMLLGWIHYLENNVVLENSAQLELKLKLIALQVTIDLRKEHQQHHTAQYDPLDITVQKDLLH